LLFNINLTTTCWFEQHHS